MGQREGQGKVVVTVGRSGRRTGKGEGVSPEKEGRGEGGRVGFTECREKGLKQGLGVRSPGCARGAPTGLGVGWVEV